MKLDAPSPRRRAKADRECPSGKWRFRSQAKARLGLRLTRGRGIAVQRAYFHPLCDGWHLTSQKAAS